MNDQNIKMVRAGHTVTLQSTCRLAGGSIRPYNGHDDRDGHDGRDESYES